MAVISALFILVVLMLTCTKKADIKHLRRYKLTLLNNFVWDIPMVTIEERRKTDRERQKRWRKRKLADGNKQTLLMLTPEAQEVLKDEKAQTGESYVRIINRAIIDLKDKLPKVPIDKSEKREHKQKVIRDWILGMDKDG